MSFSNVAVIGTIFVDCKGFAKQEYIPLGRNIGNIEFFHGGVGRNIAENLAHLGLSTMFISSVDNTAIGQEVIARLVDSGIDTEYVAVDTNGMGMWLAILDKNGDLAGSISQMPDLNILEAQIKAKGQEVLQQSSHVVLELDLNEKITRSILKLAKEYQKPVYGIPGNMDVILKNYDVLNGLQCFICNEIEAGRLLKLDFASLNIEDMQSEIKKFVDKMGMHSMVITLGSKGSVYYDSVTQESGYQLVVPVKLVDSTGAGDAFFSGTVMGLIRGCSLQQAVIYGTRTAAWTIQSAENTFNESLETVLSGS